MNFQSYVEFVNIVKKVKLSKFPYYRTRRYSYSLLLNNHNITNPDLVEKLYNLFSKIEIKNSKLYPEVLFVLKELSKKYKLYVYTDEFKDITNIKFEKFKLKRYFSEIITSSDIGLMKNAGVIAYRIFLKLAKLNSKDIVYVGDSLTSDILLAKKLKIKGILVDRENNENFNGLKILNLKGLLNVI